MTLPPFTGECSKNEARCCNGNCVRAGWAQDGYDDCGDNSDEEAQCGFDGLEANDDGYDYGKCDRARIVGMCMALSAAVQRNAREMRTVRTHA